MHTRTKIFLPSGLSKAVCLLSILLAGFSMSAQTTDPVDVGQLKALVVPLKLTPEELTSLEDIALAAYKTIGAAQAEISGDTAELTRQLLLHDVELKNLEPIVRKSVNGEYKVRMANLDRQLKIRQLLGDGRWALLFKAVRITAALERQAGKTGDSTVYDDPRLLNLLHLLER